MPALHWYLLDFIIFIVKIKFLAISWIILQDIDRSRANSAISFKCHFANFWNRKNENVVRIRIGRNIVIYFKALMEVEFLTNQLQNTTIFMRLIF